MLLLARLPFSVDGVDVRKTITVKPVLGDRPFSQTKAVAQDRWSFITGCTQNNVGIIMNVYTYVCIIYTGRQRKKDNLYILYLN